MYLSHPVRRIREDPTEDETVTLRITCTDEATADEVADRAGQFGTVHERLRFAGLLVTVPQIRVEDVCTLGGIESVETERTLRMDPDGAGEDLEYGE